MSVYVDGRTSGLGMCGKQVAHVWVDGRKGVNGWAAGWMEDRRKNEWVHGRKMKGKMGACGMQAGPYRTSGVGPADRPGLSFSTREP